MLRTALVLAPLLVSLLRGQMCTGRTLSGPYSLLLSGAVTISGKEAAAAALANLTLADDGKVAGQSSVNFDGLLLGNPCQRPDNRAPSAAGAGNAEASRRYLLEGRAPDPKRQRLLLILPCLELRGPGRAVAAAAF